MLKRVLAGIGLAGMVFAANGANAGEESGQVLDIFSYSRSVVLMRPVVYAEKAADVKPSTTNCFGDAVLTGWADAEFADGEWLRRSGQIFGGNGFGIPQDVALICVRWKFSVSDPAAVKKLFFSAAYRGGVVVYLNGKEVKRADMPEGAVTVETPAREYEAECYETPDGKLMRNMGANTAERKACLDKRIRHLEEVELPVTGLLKGVNVLAVEVHRAPYDPRRKGSWDTQWSMAGLIELGLRAPDGGVTPNLVRPVGMQVWNASPMTDVLDADYGNPCEALGPIVLAGARQGEFSGQVVVSADASIRGVKAKMSDLAAAGGGRIGADQARVRFALPTGSAPSGYGRNYRGGAQVARFDALAEQSPAEVPVRVKTPYREYKGRMPRDGAVLPVWVTVKVPADAAPGEYTGTLTVSAEGLTDTAVPVRLSVADWKMPDSKSFVSHAGIVQSAESVALQYEKPLWSEEHWKLIERSMSLLGEAGANTLLLPLIMKQHNGKESLVLWVKGKEGAAATCDFTRFDRYVDTALKHMAMPQSVCLYVYDPSYGANSHFNRVEANKAKRTAPVETVDPATGELGEMLSPYYSTPEAAPFWKPVLEQCRERLIKRGVPEKALMIGMCADAVPAEAEVATFKQVAPWATWVKQGHPRTENMYGVPVGNLAFVWGTYGMKDPAVKRGYGWKQKWLFTIFPRTGACRVMRSETLLSDFWTIQEYLVAADYRGLSRVGADFWPVFKGGTRHYGGATIAGLYSDWGQCTMSESTLDLLYPGPAGALMTERLDIYRQGIQEAEARIYVEKALADKALCAKLGDELAGRAQALLDERARYMMRYSGGVAAWYPVSGWQARSRQLFEAAAGIEAKSGK